VAEFLTTRWSLIARATQEGAAAPSSLERLCEAYWTPLFAYVLRRGLSWEDARDVTQDFFSDLLEKDWLQRADEDRGKFRTFLLTAVQRQVDSHFRSRSAQKRGGGRMIFSLDEGRVEAEKQSPAWARPDLTPEEAFDLRWALEVLGRAAESLEAEAVAAGRGEWFAQLRPFLSEDAEGGDYAAPAAALGMTVNGFAQAVHRLRERYRQALRAEISETVLDAEMLEEEMASLIAALRRNV
jgi:DNA-directed RNA polymerase specialized sigma24 family protein